MKPSLLYAIQGTGNGHVARALEVVPILRRHFQVEVLLSGAQSEVQLPFEVHHKRKGLVMLYSKKGGVSFLKTLLHTNFLYLLWEVWRFPVHKYEVIVNDFEFVSAWACKLKGKKCLGVGHQAAFQSAKVPLPLKPNPVGKLVLKHYAPAAHYLGYHFKSFDTFIKTPVIRTQIRQMEVENKGHYTVYLPAFADEKLIAKLEKLKRYRWQMFSKHCTAPYSRQNVEVFPVHNETFLESFRSCAGVLTSAGFETPAEALYLGKKLFVIPIKHQYEQYCNAAALAEMGIPVAEKLNKKGLKQLKQWCKSGKAVQVHYPDRTAQDLLRFIAPHIPESKPLLLEGAI